MARVLPFLDRKLISWACWLILLALLIALFRNIAASSFLLFSTYFLGIFIEAAPFLLLGAFISGLLEAFVHRDDLARLIPTRLLPATVMGALLGFIFPVCECGVVPVVRRLFRKGMPLSVGVALLLAAPVMNPVVFASTYIAFGWGPLLWGRFAITFVVAVTVGLVFSRAQPAEVLLHGGVGEELSLVARRPPWRSGLTSAARVAIDDFFDMGRFLVVGALLAAALQTFADSRLLLEIGQAPVRSVFAMQLLGYVLSVCSTVDAFLALSFAGGFSSGALLAFLTYGPMIDIKSTLMFGGVFRRPVLVVLIILPLLMTALISIWLNLNLALGG
ncbi:MAG: permease [Anaerolineaceae bacterium]|nr:permease [Anaerolineaceae bacterium]